MAEMSCAENTKVILEREQDIQEIKSWINDQVEWKGRTDDDFITIFLRSCDFNLELTKKTLSIYYENRRRVPQWYTNRDLHDPLMFSVIQQKIVTFCMDKNPELPSLIVTKSSRMGPDKKIYNPLLKLGLIMADIIIHRPSLQLNGTIWIVDCSNQPWWPARYMLSPTFIQNFINCYYLGMPMKLKKLIVINSPRFVLLFFNLLKPFLSQSLIGALHVLGTRISLLPDLVPVELLPEEYGGKAGPMKEHEDACVNEILAHAEYFAADGEHGFH